ncbi:MAG: tryptophan--tRNA ligase, partial [Bacteroidaceae bacterium]|nr:tryptophan--tRNA ligase [Bacteroidaceae bacterium]
FYYMNLVSVQRLQRNPTVKTELEMRKFEGGTPTGFFCYPISQAADITLFKATTVPVGEDQKPMLEQTNEIVRRFNFIYGETLVEPKILLPNNAACLRLPGTDGKAKMSKSLGNCIYLSDSAKELKKKVNSMYTDPEHIHIEQPGHLEGNTVFTYLDAFCLDSDFEKFLPDYKNLDELKEHYTRGGLGDGTCKKLLLNILNDRLEPMRQRRKEWEKDIPGVYEILRKGTEIAREVGAKTLAEVRHAMRIDYFDDKELIAEQAKRFAEANK